MEEERSQIEILLKRSSLTLEEFSLIKTHTLIGANILQGSKSKHLEMARLIALTHHERWDGTGYPRGLKGEEIPLAGRIVNMIDQYDALRTGYLKETRTSTPSFSQSSLIIKTLHLSLAGFSADGAAGSGVRSRS